MKIQETQKNFINRSISLLRYVPSNSFNELFRKVNIIITNLFYKIYKCLFLDFRTFSPLWPRYLQAIAWPLAAK